MIIEAVKEFTTKVDTVVFNELVLLMAEERIDLETANASYFRILKDLGINGQFSFAQKYEVEVSVNGNQMFKTTVEADDEDEAIEEVRENIEWDDITISGTISYNDNSGSFRNEYVNTPDDLDEYLLVEYKAEQV